MSKRSIIVVIIIVTSLLLVGGVLYWAVTSGRIKPQASENSSDINQDGTEIVLKAGEKGNLVAFPYTKPVIKGLTEDDEIYLFEDNNWKKIPTNLISAGPAFLIKTKSDKNIYVSGQLSGPAIIMLNSGDNYFGNQFLFPVTLNNVRISYEENGRYVTKSLVEAYNNKLITSLAYYDNIKQQYVSLLIKDEENIIPFRGYKINAARNKMALGFKNE